MISKEKQTPLKWKSLKTLYKILVPILLWIVVIPGAILSCFSSREGSDSRIICISITLIALILIVTLALMNRRAEKRYGYRAYENQFIKKNDFKTALPLFVMLLIVVLPFYVLIVTSLKSTIEANNIAFTWWPTQGIDLNSYKELFTYGQVIGVTMGEAIINSFIYAIIPTAAGLMVSALSAYAFAKLEFRGRNVMYQILIMTMMMPGCVTMTTAYIMYDKLEWTNSPLPLVVPGCFGAATTVMFLREYFMGIPDAMLEAARIDGAGKWKCFFEIVLPLGKPALIAQLILGFVSAYNDFIAPLIYLNEPQKYTIQVALDFLNGAIPDQTLIASAGVFSLAPMLLLYVIFQKHIISGISMSSGLKG